VAPQTLRPAPRSPCAWQPPARPPCSTHRTGLVPGVATRVKKWGFVLPPCMQCNGVRVEILALHLAAPVPGGYQLCHSAAQAGLGSSTRHVGSVYRNFAPSASQPLRLAATSSATLQHRKTGLVPGVDRRVKKWGFVCHHVCNAGGFGLRS
jgi:hypothetical protein